MFIADKVRKAIKVGNAVKEHVRLYVESVKFMLDKEVEMVGHANNIVGVVGNKIIEASDQIEKEVRLIKNNVKQMEDYNPRYEDVLLA